MTDATIESLPTEILEHIFKFLPFASIQNCVCVSTKWRDVGLEQFKRGSLVLTPNNYERKIESRVIQYVGDITLAGFNFQSANIQESNPCSILENINNRDDLKFTSLNYVEHNFRFRLKPREHLELKWYFHFSPKLMMWNYFFTNLKTYTNILGPKVTIKQRTGLRRYERPIPHFLLDQEEVYLPATFTNDDHILKIMLRKLSKQTTTMKMKKLVVIEKILVDADSNWINEDVVGKGLCHLEKVILTSRCQISPKQESKIYENIWNTPEVSLKFLDLRRSSTSIDEVNVELQAKAVAKLVTYKNTVNHQQAKAILDNIYLAEESFQKNISEVWFFFCKMLTCYFWKNCT